MNTNEFHSNILQPSGLQRTSPLNSIFVNQPSPNSISSVKPPDGVDSVFMFPLTRSSISGGDRSLEHYASALINPQKGQLFQSEVLSKSASTPQQTELGTGVLTADARLAGADELISGGRSKQTKSKGKEPGNSIDAAKDLGKLTSLKQLPQQFVGRGDRVDYYRIHVDAPSRLNLRIDGENTNFSGYLLNAEGEQMYDMSYRQGGKRGVLTQVLRTVGTYYIKVIGEDEGSNYKMSLSNELGLGTAQSIDMAGNKPIVRTGEVGAQGNGSDLYKIKIDTSTDLGITLSELDRNRSANLMLFNHLGEALPVSQKSENQSETISSQVLPGPLQPGLYYVKVLGKGRSTKYQLKMSSQPIVDRDGNNSITTAQPFDGRLSSIGSIDDRSDYWEIKTNGTEYVAIDLKGLTANADLELIRDKNGDRQVNEQDEVVFSSKQSGILDESIKGVLLDGTYYIRVTSSDNKLTSYDLSKSQRSIEGLLFRQEDSDGIYEVQGGKLRKIPDPETRRVLGLDNQPINSVSTLNPLEIGEPIPSLKEGTLLKGSDGKFYLMQNDKRRVVADPKDASAAKNILDRDLNRVSQSTEPEIKDDDDTVATAKSVGDRTQNSIRAQGSIGGSFDPFGVSVDRVDYWKFNSNGSETVTFTIDELQGNANFELIRDTNNNGKVESSEIISTLSRENPVNRTLEQGTYYLRVTTESQGAATNYTIDGKFQPIPPSPIPNPPEPGPPIPPPLPPVQPRKYQFTYFYNGENAEGSDYYTGWVIAEAGKYRVGDYVNPKEKDNGTGKDGRYLITRDDEVVNGTIGEVYIDRYYDSETQTEAIPLKYRKKEASGNQGLSSEYDFIGINDTRTDFGMDLHVYDAWRTWEGTIKGQTFLGEKTNPIRLEWADGRPKTFDPNKSTWIIVHGLQKEKAVGDIRNDLVDNTKLAEAVDNFSSDDQVLLLDWREAAYAPGATYPGIGNIPNPAITLSWVDVVAKWTSDTLKQWELSTSQLNLVGHSFGSYVASTVASDIPGGINNLVALDPGTLIVGGDRYKQTNFSDNTSWSWAFYGSALGDADRAKTAKESFTVDFSWTDPITGHGAVRQLFTDMLNDANNKNADSLSDLFDLDRMNGLQKPWVIVDREWEAKLEVQKDGSSWLLREIIPNPGYLVAS